MDVIRWEKQSQTDMPYKKAGDNVKLPAVLQSINRADIAFSIYDGDIKDGSSRCTDDVYTVHWPCLAAWSNPWSMCPAITSGPTAIA